jgi:hypothetical protein
MKRRDFITLLGGAAAWPIAAHGQEPVLPVIGLLAAVSKNEEQMSGFRQGLKQSGFVEGENVSILYRSAENEIDRLPGSGRLSFSSARRSYHDQWSAGGVCGESGHRDDPDPFHGSTGPGQARSCSPVSRVPAAT